MNYNIASAGGSSAQTLDVVNALKTYFNYSTSIQGLYRTSYTDSQWIALLKVELDAGRPIQYAGTGSGGGHSFLTVGEYRSKALGDVVKPHEDLEPLEEDHPLQR